MDMRIVRAVAPGRLVQVRRPTQQSWTLTTEPDGIFPSMQHGETNVILMDVLSVDPDTNEALLIQYTHIFPTVPFYNLPNLATQLAYTCRDGTPEQCIGWARHENHPFGRAYVNLPSTKQSIRASGLGPVTQGAELGYYAQIGRSTLPEGPHLHISMFHLPAGPAGRLNGFLQNPNGAGTQLNPELYIPCQ